MEKATVAIVTKQTVVSAPKLQDLKMKQKVSCWMNEVQNPTKLHIPICEVEDYHSSGFYSPSPNGTFLSEIEPKSWKTFIVPVMIIVINNGEEKMATMKAMIQKVTNERKGKEARIKL